MMCICQLKQHFQDWGNFYQIIIGTISISIVLWLWFKDREKEIKIKELAEQTKVLKELLDSLIVPYLEVTEIHSGGYGNGIKETFTIKFTNSGGALYNLTSESSINGYASFECAPQFNIPIGTHKNCFFSWNNSIKKDSVIILFEDKSRRKFYQELQLIERTAFFKPPKPTESF